MSIERLIQKVRDNDVVLWAGSGYSLYAGMPLVPNLKEMILEVCNEEEKKYLKEINALHEFTSTFIDMRNGSKNDLFKILRKAYKVTPKTTWVHDLMKEIPQLSTIVTTNYDKLFEESFGNEIDVVITNDHVPLITQSRVLYKIHGDIDLPQTMVVTSKDYTDFFQNQNTPIWNKIKTLFAEKTILFVGYSLADQNIDYLFDYITSQLGGVQKEAFLIAPNLPPFTITKLNKKNITYINMTGEEFTTELHNEIKKKLVIDIKRDKINPQVGLKILENHKLLPKFQATKDGLLLQSIKTKDDKAKFNLNIKFKGISFMEKLKQSFFQEFEIDADSIVSMDSHFEGIEMPGFGNLVNMKVIPKPIIEKNIDLYFKENDFELLNNKLEVFKGFEEESLIRISNELITFEIIPNNMMFTYQFKDFKRLKEVKSIFLFLSNLISGEKLTIYFTEEQREIGNPLKFNVLDNLEQQEEFLHQIELINKLIDIQNHYDVYFRNFEYRIDEEMVHFINIIWADFKGTEYYIPYLNTKINVDKDSGFINSATEGKKFNFVLENEILEVQLFNKKIPINKILKLTCEDAIVLNLEELITKIREENTPILIDVLLGSETQGFKTSLMPVKE